MMALVADAGPLIGLARIDRLSLLSQIYDPILIPPAVHRELCVHEDRPGSTVLRGALERHQLQIVNPEIPESSRLLWDLLDDGEVEAILLAHQRGAVLLIDDKRGRVLAKRRGVRITGVAGVLLAAKKRGLLEEVSPALDELVGVGYRFSPKLMSRVRQLAEEG